MRKRILAAILSICMVFTMLPMTAFAEEAEDVTSGSCGTNVVWTLKDDGTLTISGSGAMVDYEEPSESSLDNKAAPWYASRESITRVVIEDGVTGIGRNAFNGCTNVGEVALPECISQLGFQSFAGCSQLTSIKIPDGIKYVSIAVFKGCSSLREVIIPKSVTEIGSSAFRGCSSLQEIEIPEGVTEMGANTFCDCSSLQEIEIPEGVTKLEHFIFEDCSGLKKVVIPSSVTEIEAFAFSGCKSLQEIEIPEGITKIGSFIFYNCSNLQNVIIPKSLTEIGENAFCECKSLNQLLVPASVITIGEDVFSGTPIISLIGAKGSTIETYANQNGYKFTEHMHEWDDVDKDNLTCTDNRVTCTCTACGAVEEQEVPVAHDEIVPAEELGNICISGVSAVYKCTLCGRYFSDESGSTEIGREEIETATAHELSKVEGVPATCETGGNIEYYKCESCGKLLRNAEGSEEIALDNINIEKLGHSVAKVQAEPATCETEGSIEHYKCENCGKLFRDANGLEEITLDDVGVEKLGHNIVKVEAKSATCEEDGNIEYYKCESCKKLFLDADGLEEATAEDIVIRAIGHSLWRVGAKAPTCTGKGNIEYFYCDICDKKFSDGFGKQQIFAVEVNPLGHKYEVVTTKATLSANGGVTKVCVNCGHKVKVSTYYKISTVKLSKNTYRYTGKVQAPKVTVKDSKGKKISASNYTVSYSQKKSKNVGKYKVTVKFKGKMYSGNKTLYYTILPANVTLKSVSSNTDGELTAKWGTKKGIDGYQIRYSKKSSMKGSKTKTVKGAKTKQYTIQKLAKGKKYYVQVRGYKKVSGKTYYGAWSKKKSAKTLNMRLNYKSLSLEPGQTSTLKLIGAKKSINWRSSNPAVANVNSAGKVTAVADGTATITATCGGRSYSCIVKVKTVTKFDKLYNYINSYGSVNSGGNRFVKYSFYLDGDLWSIGIVYDKNKNQFTFSCFDPDRIVSSMSIGRNGSTTGKCEFVCSAYYGSCIAYADLNVPTYTVNSTLNFNLETYYGGTWEEYNKMANLHLLLSMKFWDSYLKKNLGFGMSGLGFTSY